MHEEIGSAFPRRIQIQTHNRCNYACSMCPYPATALDTKAAWMDDELYRGILEQIEQSGQTVTLCLMLQNEPMVDKRFVDFVRQAHAIDNIKAIATVTNGSRLGHEVLDELATFPRFQLTVSINATDQRRYLQVHGRDRWDRVHEVLTTWEGDRSQVVVSSVVGSDDVEAGNRFRHYWSERGYSVRLLPYSTRAGTKGDDRVMQQVEEDYGYCSYPVETLTLRWDGEALLCCQDWSHDETFGSLANQSIAELWNGPAMKSLRRDALGGKLRERASCKGCDYPMRSSQRLALDHRLRGEPRPASSGAPVLPHRSEIRDEQGQRRPMVVFDIDSSEGVIQGFVGEGTAVPRGPVEARIAIGYRGEFVIDRPAEVWCSGLVEAAGEVQNEMQPVRLTLDRSHRAYDFFGWYAADWRNA